MAEPYRYGTIVPIGMELVNVAHIERVMEMVRITARDRGGTVIMMVSGGRIETTLSVSDVMECIGWARGFALENPPPAALTQEKTDAS